jgi:hypothetical protein
VRSRRTASSFSSFFAVGSFAANASTCVPRFFAYSALPVAASRTRFAERAALAPSATNRTKATVAPTMTPASAAIAATVPATASVTAPIRPPVPLSTPSSASNFPRNVSTGPPATFMALVMASVRAFASSTAFDFSSASSFFFCSARSFASPATFS